MSVKYIIHFQDGSDDGLRADGIDLLSGWIAFYESVDRNHPVVVYPAASVKAIYREEWA